MIQNIQNGVMSIVSFFQSAVDGVSQFTTDITGFRTYLDNFVSFMPSVLFIFMGSFFTVMLFNRVLKLL